jgi:hypothetical protein
MKLFNRDRERVSRAKRTTDTSDLQDWIGDSHNVALNEDVVGLGGYPRSIETRQGCGSPKPHSAKRGVSHAG